MDIKVVGMGCDKCDQLYLNVKEALKILGQEVEVDKVEDLVEIVKLGVMTAPTLMVNGKAHAPGRVLSTDAVVEILKKV